MNGEELAALPCPVFESWGVLILGHSRLLLWAGEGSDSVTTFQRLRLSLINSPLLRVCKLFRKGSRMGQPSPVGVRREWELENSRQPQLKQCNKQIIPSWAALSPQRSPWLSPHLTSLQTHSHPTHIYSICYDSVKAVVDMLHAFIYLYIIIFFMIYLILFLWPFFCLFISPPFFMSISVPVPNRYLHPSLPRTRHPNAI